MITEAREYFADGCGRCPRFATADCSARRWAEGLHALRAICLGAGLEEQVKWGHPCYLHRGRNIALIGAFRGDFRLSFLNAARLSDPAGLLERPGPNSRDASMIRFTGAAQVAELAPSLQGYLAEAMRRAEEGPAPKRAPPPVELPEDLAGALADDPALAAGFAALTLGRQRSYVIHLSSAKRPETRLRRIEGYRPRIMAGKGATER